MIDYVLADYAFDLQYTHSGYPGRQVGNPHGRGEWLWNTCSGADGDHTRYRYHGLSRTSQPAQRHARLSQSKFTAIYTTDSECLVTAFYGISDPSVRRFRYSSASHNPPPPRSTCSRQVTALIAGQSSPLGISEGENYRDCPRRG